MQEPSRVIFIQLFAIGDVLMCEPAIAAFRQCYPETEISFVTGKQVAPLFMNHPAINHLVIWDKGFNGFQYLLFLLSLLQHHYDYLVDFQKNPRTYLFSLLIRSKVKISYQSKRRNLFYNRLMKSYDLYKYVAYEKYRLVKPILNNDISPAPPNIYVSEQDYATASTLLQKMGYTNADFIIAVSPVSKVASRRWKPVNFARLCDFLYNEYNVRFIFTWGPGEKHQVEDVVKLMASPKPDLNYDIDKLTVLYAIFKQADMYLGNDNGPRHLAIAAKIPTMCIFSHMYADYWTPPGTDMHRYVVPKLLNPPPDEHRIDYVDYTEAEQTCSQLVRQIILTKNAQG